MDTKTHELLEICYRERKSIEKEYAKKKYSRSTYYRKKQQVDSTIKFLLSIIERSA